MDINTAIMLFKRAETDIEAKRTHKAYRKALSYYLNQNDITKKNQASYKLVKYQHFKNQIDF